MNNRLRQIRTERNVSAKEMCELIEIQHPTYYKKENGQVRFSLSEAAKIADFFNLAISDIFFEVESSKIEQN